MIDRANACSVFRSFKQSHVVRTRAGFRSHHSMCDRGDDECSVRAIIQASGETSVVVE